MSPSRILEQCLAEVFSLMHKATLSVVLKAIDALGAGSWLTMTEIARHWPGAQRVAAPLKATDRLLSSPRVAQYRAMLYAGLTRWLIRQDRPLIVVDWSDVKVDGRFRLLRAGLAVDGRTLTLYEEVHSRARSGQVTLETAFLRSLGLLLPPGCRPIVVTDAGFRVPWLRAVKRVGWDYVGRVRGMVKVQRVDPTSSSWELCSAVHRLARRDKAREPWLLASSLSCAEATTRRVVNLYARRMRIEESFRDLKSGDLGVGFEHSRTDKRGRLAHLLLLFALSQLAVWLLGWCEEARGQGGRLEARTTSERKHHSLWRLGLEVIKRPLWWPPASLVHDFLRRVAKACPQRLCTAVEG